MLRVDELYYNTFWKWIQSNKPDTRLFYCDPPGSTSPLNLFNYGADPELYYGDNFSSKPPTFKFEQDYIFCHDQEPIHINVHKALFDQVIKRTIDMWSEPKGHIVVSELNSIFLDEIIDTYGWEVHYYFYHGWAALDWYRGYNRSFLIPRARDRTPTYTFISPNRIIGGKRDHRVLFLYHLFKNSLEHNHITCSEVCPAENTSIFEIAEMYTTNYPDITEVFQDVKFPYLFKDENTQIMSSCWLSNFDESADSLFYIPTETVFFGQRLHLTEKTFKPIALEMPFILVAPAGSLEYLRSYGFKTFNGIIDESYDTETNDLLRLEKIIKLIKELDSLSKNEKMQIHKQCLPIVEHNYHHFYFGEFEGILWKELSDMFSKML
jgi:hypothetical protein